MLTSNPIKIAAPLSHAVQESQQIVVRNSVTSVRKVLSLQLSSRVEAVGTS